MKAPLRIATDGQGFIYVADASSHLVFKYSESGSLVETIDAVGEPISLALNNENRLFIGDGTTGSIYRYDESQGASLFYAGSEYPSSMEFGPDNTLYVTDSKQQQVLVLDLSGNLIRTIGSGTLDFPTGIALDNKNQQILVGEHGGAGTGFSPTVRVYVFDLQGNLIRYFGRHGNSDGRFYRIQGLTVGRCGNIYVVDPYLTRISVFDDNGVFITKFGDFGFQDGELNIPMDITFDSQGRILVSSMNNGGLELYSISDIFPSSNIRSGSAMICEGESTDLEVAFTGTAPWSFTYTIDGLNPTVVNTSDNPHTLTVSEEGHYEIVALTDANYTGTCFTGSADVVVNSIPPTAVMTGDNTICDGQTAEIFIDFTGSAPWNFTYTQNGLNPVSVTTTNNPHILEVSEAGLYQVVELEGGACSGTSIAGSANIVVNPLPTATMTDGRGQIIINPGESAELAVELTGVPPWNITYTVDDQNPASLYDITEGSFSLISSQEGIYEIVEVMDSRCSSTISSGYPEIVWTSSLPPPTSRIDGGDLFICPGDHIPIPVHFTGTAPWTFTYKTDGVATTINNTYSNPYIINAFNEGIYEVIALEDKYLPGTEFLGSALVSYIAQPVSDFSYIDIGLELSLFNLSEHTTLYNWDFGDGYTSTEENPVHIYDYQGVYDITLSTANELCAGTSITKTISISETPGEDPAESDLLIYPNPSAGMVTLEVDNIVTAAILEIISQSGSILYSEVFPEGFSIIELDLGYLKPGIYIVKITTQDQIITGKLSINNKKN
jgi:PKD repeat protein/sugar lactone lactonase YvrE